MKKAFSLFVAAVLCSTCLFADQGQEYYYEPVPPVAPVVGTTYGTGAALGIGAIIVGSVAAALIATSGSSGGTSH